MGYFGTDWHYLCADLAIALFICSLGLFSDKASGFEQICVAAVSLTVDKVQSIYALHVGTIFDH